MRGVRCFIAGCLLGLTVAAAAAPELSVALSRNDCLPGDLIELRVSMTHDSPADFDLELPEDDAVEWVARHHGPLQYNSGVYTREDVVVFQPAEPGPLVLKGLRVTVHADATETEETLALPEIHVRSYGITNDSFAPEPLPADKSAAERYTFLPWFVGFAALLVALLVFALRKKRPRADSPSEDRSATRELAEILESPELPLAHIERLLATQPDEFSDRLRAALERAVYGRSADRDELRRLLEREVAP